MLPSKKFVIKRCVPGFVRSKFFLFFIYHRYSIFFLVTLALLSRYIFLHHFPAKITGRRPQMPRAPLPKIRKSIPQCEAFFRKRCILHLQLFSGKHRSRFCHSDAFAFSVCSAVKFKDIAILNILITC